MPITSDLGGKNYVLGRGRVFFDRFAPNFVLSAALQGEGERYLGNTPEFNTTGTSEDLEHFDADSGVKVKDDSVQLSMDRSGSFTCDNINSENVALQFLGDASTVTQTSAVAAVSLVTAKKGRFYQVGASESLPAGVRNISNVVVKKGSPGFATTVAASGNYEVDEDLGRIYVLPNAADIPDDTILQITYDRAASTREQVVSSSNSIYGALRFVSDNPKGANRDYYFPYVKMAPDGDYALKGEEWQSMGFTFEILKKASNVESVYIDTRGVV